MGSAVLNVVKGDTSHFAVAVNTNIDNTHADGVTVVYQTSDANICDVNPNTGALNPTGVGQAVITETSTRGTFIHSDNGTVNVADVNSGDFNSSLTFN